MTGGAGVAHRRTNSANALVPEVFLSTDSCSEADPAPPPGAKPVKRPPAPGAPKPQAKKKKKSDDPLANAFAR